MKYLLVLQFTGRTLEDYDSLVALEERLIQELPGLVEWDGHDFGSGEGNIFLATDEPERAFKAVKEKLDVPTLGDLRAAFRETEGEDYTILWPPDLGKFIVL